MVLLRDGEGVEALDGANFAENERICTSLGVSTGGGKKGERGGSAALMRLRGLRLGPHCGEGVEGGGWVLCPTLAHVQRRQAARPRHVASGGETERDRGRGRRGRPMGGLAQVGPTC
jgi:hypothetical protein